MKTLKPLLLAAVSLPNDFRVAATERDGHQPVPAALNSGTGPAINTLYRQRRVRYWSVRRVA